MAPDDLGLGAAPSAPLLPQPVQPKSMHPAAQAIITAIAAGLGPGRGTGILQGMQASQQQAQMQARQGTQDAYQQYQREQQMFQQEQQAYQAKQRAVADAVKALGEEAPNLTSRIDFDGRANAYASYLQGMGIRVSPQFLTKAVPYLEPTERDTVAKAVANMQKAWPESFKTGMPMEAHIQWTDPKTKQPRDMQIGQAIQAGLIAPPVDATGKWMGAEVKKPTPSLTPREGVMNGREVFWTMGENGQPQEVAGVSPTPPASAQQGNGGGTFPPRVQQRIDAKGKEFNGQPVVKRIQQMAEAVTFADGLDINTKNPSDDQAMIYAFAKAMDPDSVVREGEYATVQKYAQSWAQSFGFNAQRIFSNSAFLTPEARANMKNTIRAKYRSAVPQYRNVRKNYVGQVDRIIGKPGAGADWVVDYEAAFPEDAPASPAAVPDVNGARERARSIYKNRGAR